jgi:Metallo-beta-lactamase superfamily
MSFVPRHTFSRRGFCICCAVAAGFVRTGSWLSPSQAYAEAQNIVDLIRDAAAKAPIKVHRLRGNVSILEGSGGNIAVLTGADGKVFIDAGITASRPRILEAANGLSRDPIRHLINTHWHFDHADGNQWLNAEGAAIIAHENTHKHLLVAQRVEDWDFNFPSPPLAGGFLLGEASAEVALRCQRAQARAPPPSAHRAMRVRIRVQIRPLSAAISASSSLMRCWKWPSGGASAFRPISPRSRMVL